MAENERGREIRERRISEHRQDARNTKLGRIQFWLWRDGALQKWTALWDHQ